VIEGEPRSAWEVPAGRDETSHCNGFGCLASPDRSSPLYMEGEPGSSEMIPFGAIVKEPRYAACGMDSRAPVRPPLRPLSTGFRHRFSGIRHRFLSAVRGAQSGDFARFAVNPLTPCFVTGKNFLRMRPGAGNDLSISQRFDHPSPRCNRSSSQCNAPIAHQGRLHPSDQTIRISLSPSGTGFLYLIAHRPLDCTWVAQRRKSR
jgi:hypothetical protein